MANIRKIAKEISKDNSIEFLKYAKSQNFMNQYYEEILTEGLVIANLKDIDLIIQNLDWWLEKVDSWAYIDSVCCHLKSVENCNDKDNYFDYFQSMCFSNKEFVARFGIVALLCYFLEEKYIDRVLKTCKEISNDAFYVQMGIAWLVSVSFVKFREKTLDLIKSKVLSKFVQNKSISKCNDSFRVSSGDKLILKQYRK